MTKIDLLLRQSDITDCSLINTIFNWIDDIDVHMNVGIRQIIDQEKLMFKNTLGMAAFAVVASFSLSAFADGHSAGDPIKGKKVFKKCAACHAVGPDAKIKVGPPLNDLFGRTAGTYESFKYGKSIVAAGTAGLVWTDEELFEYLKNPKKYLRAKLDDKKAKSKMALKLKKKGQRADVIAYLKTFSKPAE